MQIRAKFSRALGACAVVLATMGALAVPASADVVPTEVGDLGGPLHAEFYASGLEVAADGTIVIADTGNSQVAKYDQAGNQIWRTGGPGSGDGQFFRPRDVSVASTGQIWVVDAENERIVRLAGDGTWIGVLNTPARFFLGGTFKNDLYYMADINGKVRVFDLTGTQVQEFGEQPATSCDDLFDIRDATADSQGYVYVANYRKNAINVFAPTGECLFSWGSTGDADGQFRTPYGVSTAFDPVMGEELVYVADAQNNRVQVFKRDGTFVGKFGTQGAATQEGTIYTLRRVAPATDGSGDVWVADLWGWRLERFARTVDGSANGTWQYAQTIGHPIAATTDDAVFHEPRGMAIAADGTVYVMDTIHHRIVKMRQDGTVLGSCGSRGDGDGQYNWPRDLDIDEATGDLWVADTKKNRIEIIKPNCTFVAKRGSAGTGPSQFTWVRSIAIRQSDRTAWLTDTQNDRVTVWNVATKSAIGSYGTGNPGSGPGQLNRPMGIAVNEANGHIFVADTINNRIVELAANPGGTGITMVRTYTAGFQQPEAVEIAADGTIYVADTANSRIVMLAPNGSVIGTFGQGALDHPAGITIDTNGAVFVSDSFHDRVVVYSPTTWTPRVADGAAPNGTVTTPTANQVFPSSPITLTGTATDDVAVAAVRVNIKHNGTGQWWNGTGWSTAVTDLPATLASPSAASTTWSYTWTPPASGSFAVQVTAVDTAAKVDASRPLVNFKYTPPVDSATPDGSVTTPTAGQVFPTSPITFTGNATDDLSVASVRVNIKNSATGQWWNGSGWGSSVVNLAATLANPGATSTAWSYTWAPPANGSFAVQVTAVDGAGKVDPTKPLVSFKYTPPVDSANPNGTVTTPTGGQVFTSSPITITGGATDDLSVAHVWINLKSAANGQWWTGSGWSPTVVNLEATLANPGATSTSWSYDFTPPANGQYSITVTAGDGVGKVDGTKPFVQFRKS